MSKLPDFVVIEDVTTFLVTQAKKDSASAWLQGAALLKAKDQFPGEFTKWRLKSLPFSLATSNRLMNVASAMTFAEASKLTLTEVHRKANPQPKRGTTPAPAPTVSAVRKITTFISSGKLREMKEEDRAAWVASLRDLVSSVEAALGAVEAGV